jgi:alternative ribosome-rescue factor
MNLLLVKKMVIKSNKKNLIAKDLFTKKYKPKVVKPKKGKGSFKKKRLKLKSCTDLLYYF